MNEYLFENIDYDNDPEWVVKDFFNSINLLGRLLDSVEKIIGGCGLVINETYCHFPDLENSDPEFHFDGIMFGVWGGEVVVPESVGFQYSRLACERYLYLHPGDAEKVKPLLVQLRLKKG